MTITTSNDLVYLWCDGCGKLQDVAEDWYEILDLLDELDWYTSLYNYGYGEGYEHFCCDECRDPI